MPLRYLVDEHLRGTLPQVLLRVARREGFEIDVVQVGLTGRISPSALLILI